MNAKATTKDTAFRLMTTQLLFAPFRGITHKAYRNAFARHIGSIDVFYAPFISGQDRIHPSKLQDILPAEENAAHTVPQVLSNNAGEIIELGNVLASHGYKHLNWNLGCPFARIANKKKGCGMLPYPLKMEHILSQVSGAMNIALSVKTRLGHHHPEEIIKILEVLNQFPIQHVVVHPRTGKQVYTGKADPLWYAECLKISKHPLIYNGDIFNLAQYNKLKTLFPGQSEWMLGRGALINPFLASEIRGKTLSTDEKRVKLLAFHHEMWVHARAKTMNQQKRIGSMKAIWHYMSGILQNSSEAFLHIKRSVTDKAYLTAVNKALQQDFATEEQIESHFLKLTKQ